MPHLHHLTSTSNSVTVSGIGHRAISLAFPSSPRSRAFIGAAAIALITATVATTVPMLAVAAAEQQSAPQSASCGGCTWTRASVDALITEIAAARNEGLDPSAYDARRLIAIADTQGPGTAMDAAADAVALTLADHYLMGRVAERSRQSWYIARADEKPAALATAMRKALETGQVQPWLRSLLPTDPRYAALRTAYATMPAADGQGREQVRANLERWRWMPRNLGPNYIFVNVPSYTLAVIDNGVPVSSYDVVVGAPATPTPQMSATARSVVVNPSWNVPPSIIRSSNMRIGKPGFISTSRRGALSFSQPPGPRNALGRIKIDMPNPDAIYLHDTQAKSLFAKTSRAFSHGCIRVKDITRLATELVQRDAGDINRVVSALKGYRTTPVLLQTARPVYIVYFTVEVGSDGKLIRHDDPYGRDTRLSTTLTKLDQQLANRTVLAANSIGESL